jgi:hypothetical protein
MTEQFEQGWTARPFVEQFPELSPERAEYLDGLNSSITNLYMADVITESEKDRARGRFGKVVSQELKAARSKK